MTKVSMPIIGWVSEILGWMINVIYSGLELIGITNIGLSIILFTLVVYLLMTPLQIKQQKFSKLNAVMQPEIQKIQKKYNGKKDQDSMMKQNEEISAVYQKYGVSPTGSCVQLLVQMPVLLALYQVIYHIPGYISGVRNVFTGLTAKIMSVDGFGSIISQFLTDNKITMTGISANTEFTKTTTIDFLYKLSPSQMEKFSQISDFSGFSDLFDKVAQQTSHMNTFLNLNISGSQCRFDHPRPNAFRRSVSARVPKDPIPQICSDQFDLGGLSYRHPVSFIQCHQHADPDVLK